MGAVGEVKKRQSPYSCIVNWGVADGKLVMELEYDQDLLVIGSQTEQKKERYN